MTKVLVVTMVVAVTTVVAATKVVAVTSGIGVLKAVAAAKIAVGFLAVVGVAVVIATNCLSVVAAKPLLLVFSLASGKFHLKRLCIRLCQCPGSLLIDI